MVLADSKQAENQACLDSGLRWNDGLASAEKRSHKPPVSQALILLCESLADKPD